MLMLCYVFMCFSLLVVVLDVFGVLALFSKFYIGVYYTCDCSCMYALQSISSSNISFLSDPTLTRDNIIDVMGEVEMWDWEQSNGYLDMPMNTHNRIVRQHGEGTYDCKFAIIDELLTNHPYPRWEQWVCLLEDMEREGQARAGLAQEVKDKYITSKSVVLYYLCHDLK